MLSEFTTINGHRKSFQFPRNVKMITTDRAGLANGKQIRQKRPNSDTPSIRPASSNSLGMLPMNWRMTNTPKAVSMPGIRIPW